VNIPLKTNATADVTIRQNMIAALPWDDRHARKIIPFQRALLEAKAGCTELKNSSLRNHPA
jgi:hypothetical protein